MSSVTTDYTGRTIDLLIFDTPRTSGMTTVQLGIPNPAMECTGIQKLAQIVIMELLTDQGSSSDTEFGTNFLPSIRYGQLHTDSDIRSEFALAAGNIIGYLSRYQDVNTPSDERLASVVLTDFTLDRDQIVLNVKVTSEAGDTRMIYVPTTAVIL